MPHTTLSSDPVYNVLPRIGDHPINGRFKEPKLSDPNEERDKKRAWVVYLLSTPSYLPGVLVLAHSLRKYKSRYPLIVAVNPKLPQETKNVLIASGLQVREVEPLLPRGKMTLIAERFVDTWTKLTLFGFTEYERLVLIDGDMMLRQNMDEVFDLDLNPDQIAANHACVCNLDKSSWAPEDWTREMCAYTLAQSPEDEPIPAAVDTPRTHTLLNSGLVVLTPSKEAMRRIEGLLNSESPTDQEKIASWMFPDQDLLADVFRGKWIALPWYYNAIKTMRYWHGNFYRDELVKNLHYIVMKPWQKRPPRDENGEYIVNAGEYGEIRDGDVGKSAEHADAVTHDWWWREYEETRAEMMKDPSSGLSYLEKFVAK